MKSMPSFFFGQDKPEVMLVKAFVMGAVGYPLLEMIARGRTHPSMALAGGLSMEVIHRVNRRMQAPLPVKALVCAGAITGIEAICGVVFNRDHQVWDYRRMPCNWRGQVCVPYTLVWYGLSAGALMLDKVCSKA